MKLDQKSVAWVIGLVGILAGAAGGYLKITTPEAAECQVQLADRTARLELVSHAADSCEKALDLCASPGSPR